MPTQLPAFSLCGPQLPGAAAPNQVFWTTRLIAPNYDYVHTQQVERIHPIRTILLDASAGIAGPARPLPPRLIDAYLTTARAGDMTTTAADPIPLPQIQITLQAPGGVPITLNGWTKPQAPNETDGLYHITAAPLPCSDADWAWQAQGHYGIRVPAFRLLQGAIPIVTQQTMLFGNLRLTNDPNTNQATIWLVRDGIELTAEIMVLGQLLTGVFLLRPSTANTFRLTLLPDRLDVHAATPTSSCDTWRNHWNSVVQLSGDKLPGYQIDMAKGLPSLSWIFRIDGATNTLLWSTDNAVNVPGDTINVRLTGPANRQGTGGEIDLKPPAWSVELVQYGAPAPATPAVFADAIAQSGNLWSAGGNWQAPWNSDPATDPAYQNFIAAARTRSVIQPTPAHPRLIISAAILPAKVPSSEAGIGAPVHDWFDIVTLPPPPPPPPLPPPPLLPAPSPTTPQVTNVNVQCQDRSLIFDELELAQALRAAQNLPEPAQGLAVRNLDRPLLWGFLPLDDGWLQFPTPNRPAPDPALDTTYLVGPKSAPSNVLTGYLDFGEQLNLAKNLSAADPFSVTTAPWNVSVFATQAISISLVIDTIDHTPVGAFVRLIRPQMEADGWLWLSSDCPDELEALPRLGAGPGQYLNVSLRVQSTEPDPYLNVRLPQLTFQYARNGTAYDTISDRVLELDLFFNPNAQGWDDYLHHAQMDVEYRALTGLTRPPPPAAPATDAHYSLFPCVRWQRHRAMPLASTMSMTRTVTAAIPPLESRDLVPFFFQPDLPVSLINPAPQLRLAWNFAIPTTHVFPTLTLATMAPSRSWPWAWDVNGLHEGISLAALGAPGAELSFFNVINPIAAPWPIAASALRYDLPSLDEAFANAKLPPVPAIKGADNAPPPPPYEPPARALDWESMRKLWQLRKTHHTLSRVMHSHLVPYSMRGPGNNAIDLVGGWTWPVNGTFHQGQPANALPYGTITIGGTDLTGNEALLGLEGPIPITKPLPQGAAPVNVQVDVTGYSPGAFRDGAFLRDSRGVGLDSGVLSNGTLHRKVSFLDNGLYQEATLVSLTRPVAIDGLNGLFWLKDIGFTGAWALQASEGGINAWQDRNFPFQGGEWRLWSQVDTQAREGLETGRNLISYYGFGLEPLQLTACQLNGIGTEVQSATIRCLLHLGPRSQTPNQGNYVDVLLQPSVNTPGNLKIQQINLPNHDLEFAFPIEDPAAVERHAQLIVPAGGVISNQLSHQNSTLIITLFGQEMQLAGTTIATAGNLVTIHWNGPAGNALAPVAAGSGTLGIAQLTLKVPTEIDTIVAPPKITLFKRWLALLPTDTVLANAPVPAVLGIPALFVESTWTYGAPAPSSTDVYIFGEQVIANGADPEQAVKELSGSVSLNLKDVSYNPLQLMTASLLSLGLVAKLDNANQRPFPGVIDLAAGYVHAQVSEPDAANDPQPRVVAEATRRLRGSGHNPYAWMGALTAYLHVNAHNLLQWPEVTVVGGQIQTAPSQDDVQPHRAVLLPQNPTALLDFNGANPRNHSVIYRFWGQTVSFVAASTLADPVGAAVISFPVEAQHVLTPPNPADREIKFTSVETIVIGRLNSLAPIVHPNDAMPPNPDTRAFNYDPLTFGARYNIEPGTVNALPAMPTAGIGRLCFMLQGALGLPFRVAVHDPLFTRSTVAADQNPLVIAGGFAGLMTWKDQPRPNQRISVPLIRLPVFAVLTGPGSRVRLPQNGGQKSYSWADLGWKEVEMRLRFAATPASKAYADILSAIKLAAGADLAAAALLADQAFPALPELDFPGYPPNNPNAQGNTVFFPAAALAVQQLFHEAAVQGAIDPDSPTQYRLPTAVVTLLSDTNNLAASLRPAQSADDTSLTPAAQQALLVTLGDDVVICHWPDVSGPANVIPLRAKGAVDHPQPVAALLARVESKYAFSYGAFDLSTPRRRLAYRAPAANLNFPEAQRGYPIQPGDLSGATLYPWLYPAEENHASPVRDEFPLAQVAPGSPLYAPARLTGIAGLAHGIALPRQAAPEDSQPIFLSEARAPIYQTDAVYQGLPGNPIGWLSPGHARPRLPGPVHVQRAISDLYAGTKPLPTVQWIVPNGTDLASVGDRAGISLARITRLETAVPLETVEPEVDFDGTIARFGHAAQGGAWHARTERTPRPGRLPQNTYTTSPTPSTRVNRRPCPSTLWLKPSCDLVRGPADIISGEFQRDTTTRVVAWTAKFIAGAEWDGMVTDKWDGSISLTIEFDIAPTVNAPDMPSPTELLRMIFHFVDAKTLVNTASLVIGGTTLAYAKIDFGAFAPPGSFSIVTSQVHHAVVRTVLRFDSDAADNLSSPAQIAQAFVKTTTLPDVELRLNIFADAPTNNTPFTIPSLPNFPGFLLSRTAGVMLPFGQTRPPITMRMALSPVLSGRGALPLPRHSLVFSDPDYDRSLGSMPAMHKLPVLNITDAGLLRRGQLNGYLYADRKKAELDGRLLVMADFSFDRPLPGNITTPDDYDTSTQGTFVLSFQRISKSGDKPQDLFLFDQAPLSPINISLGQVYEIPIALLRDAKGNAILVPGDLLSMTITHTQGNAQDRTITFYDNAGTKIAVTIDPNAPNGKFYSRNLLIEVSGTPVAEPPPALYAALLRRTENGNARISVPLHAQSPYPWRIAPINAKADFRAGFVRRSAFFVWSLARPVMEWGPGPISSGVYLLKVERNGQTYLPYITKTENEFTSLRTV